MTGSGGRIASFVALFGAMLLLGFGTGLSFYIDHTEEARRLDNLAAQARILAATETAALAFNDRQAAQEYLIALHANPAILAAGLYTPSGALFVSYPDKPPASLPRALQEPIPRSSGNVLSVTEPVEQGRTLLGRLIVQAPAEPLSSRLQRDGPIALLVAMAALLVAVLGFAQMALRRANRALGTRAEELVIANDRLEQSNRSLQEQIARREEAEAALRQSRKMEAIGQLTGGVAHDFNNLLQVVQGNLERLQLRSARDGTSLAPELARLVDAAMQGARRAASLTQQLLAFSRRQPLAPRSLDMNKLIAATSELLGRTLGETIVIETVMAARLWPVLVDENQLQNALLNLAVNARDAMPGGGKLTIETANVFLDEAYAKGEDEVRAGQYAMLAVTDTGTGMPPDVLDKVFEPFFTTKEIGRGTGLGLSQVYGFIKQSGGHVKIYSEPGRGTTVKIYLPRLLRDSDQAGDLAESAELPHSQTREAVLVVEDEEEVRALSVEILRDLGYMVIEAANASAALTVLERQQPVDLLFTDVGLPGGMNGRQLADRARGLRPGLKVLFTTAYARNALVHHGRLDPGVELLTKPFPAADLAQRVRTLLDRDISEAN